jgi:dolichol-phosphate mannosyltransferase
MEQRQSEHQGGTAGETGKRYRRTIIIPAYNEERRIEPTLKAYLSYYGEDTEILVVLNGCLDRTADIVGSFLPEHRNMRMEETDLIGKGGALMLGFRLARGDVLAHVDADGSTSPQDLDMLMGAMGDCAGVIGSRWIDKSLMRVKQSLYRRMTSRVFNIIVRLLFRLPYRDTQCGAKAFKRECIASIVDELGTTNYAFDVDVLYLLHKRGFEIKEIPLAWEDMPGTKIRMPRDAFLMLGAVIRMRIKYSRFKNIVN